MELATRKNAECCYSMIDNKANTNAMIQGGSGIFGILTTAIADVATIPLIYVAMWNDIREVYGQSAIAEDDALNVLKNILPEVLSDILLDKVLGNVPLVGIYFNAICAKQMTWRLGTLFTVLASRGDAISNVKCKETMIMIRHMFPQKDMFKFITPDHAKFMQLVNGIEGASVDDYNKKIDSALAIFEQNS